MGNPTPRSLCRRWTGSGLIRALIFAGALSFGLFLTPRPALAANFTVNNPIDGRDTNPGDGVCRDGQNLCSLRAAIMETNALAGPDTIYLPTGTYTLMVSGRDENAAATGDLDITDALTITGTSGDPSTVVIDGGGIDKVFSIDPTWNKSFATTIQNVTIQNGHNTSPSSGDGYGGALDFDGYQTGTLTIDNCIIKGSQNDLGPGGGLAVTASGPSANGTVTITHTRISGNSNANDQGGGLWVGSGLRLSMSDSIVENNTAGRTGGGVYFAQTAPAGTHSITTSTIVNNRAGSIYDGGGVYTSAALTIANSTVSGNSAGGNGGGIWDGLYSSNVLTLTNVTVAANTATSSGGGLYHNGNVGGRALLQNTIVAGNSATTNGDVSGNVDPTSSYNLIGTGGSGGLTNGTNGNQVGMASPKLGALTTINGWPQVIPLLPGSPALDAGNNALVSGSTDQRGGPRTLDAADADTTQTVDIGAYEASPMIALIPNQGMTAGSDKTVTFNIGDGSQAITGAAISGNTTAVPNGALSLTGSGSTRTLTIAGSQVSGGSATITVTLSYNGASVSTSFPLTVTAAPDLKITKSHSGIFRQGQAGSYTLGVTNVGQGSSSGTVTVTDTLPAGLTATAISGSGWTCSLGTATCTRSDVLAPGNSYLPITVTVSVAGNASDNLTNTATVSGGGDTNPLNNTADDPTTVLQNTTTALTVSNGTYGDTVNLAATVTAGLSGTVQFALSNGIGTVGTVPVSGGTATLPYTLHIPAGTYTVTATFIPTDPGYVSSSQSRTLTVARASLTIKADDAARDYGAANPAFTATTTGFVLGDTLSSLSGTLTLTTTADAHSTAGTYAITPGGVSSLSYTITFVPGTLTVAPVPLTVTADNAARTYGAGNPAFTATYSGLVAGDTPASLSGPLTFTTPATTASAPGPYPVTPGGLTSPNYIFTFVGGTLTVSPAPLTVTADNQTRPYGSVNPTLTAAISGFVLGQDETVLSGTLSVTTTATRNSDADTYPITPSGLASDNYSIKYVPGTLTVTRAQLTVTAGDQSRLYGDANPDFAAGYSGFVLSDGPGVLLGTLTFTTSATPDSDAGTYSVTPSGLLSPNYTFNYVPGHLTVTPAPLTITANDKSRVYGDPNPAFDVRYAGFKRGQSSSVLSGTLSFATPATAGSAPSTYAITAAGLTSGNYDITYLPGTLTVSRRPLTVTADAKTKTYGDANPLFTISYSGFAPGEGAAVLGGTLTVTTTATVASGAATYPITPAGLTSPNYEITFVDGTLTVNKADLTVTVNDATRVYGNPNPDFTVRYSPFVLGETPAVLTGTPEYTTTATVASNVGSYAVAVTGLTAANYTIHFADGALTVTPRALTVTADDKTKTYGAANPVFTATYAGLAPGDDASVLGGPLTFTTAATNASAPGDYTITPGGYTSPNYTYTYAGGTLTVGKAPLTVKANDAVKTYGDTNPAFTASYEGFVLGQDATVLSGTLSLTTTATSASDADTYDITPAGLTSLNYDIAFAPGTLTVNKAPLTVTADNKTRAYGDPNPVFTAHYSGFVLGQDAGALEGALTFTTTATESSDADTYAITPSGFTSTNYDITFAGGTLTIDQVALHVTVDDATKLYGSRNPAFTVSYSGFVLGQDASVLDGTLAFSTTATDASDVGTYAVSVSSLTSPNYTITYGNGTLTVTPQPLTVSADDTTRTYGDANPALTVSYSGFVLGQDASVLSGPLSLTTATDVNSNAGTYPIVPGGLTATNYAITFQNGTLTVAPKALTVTAEDKAKTYGDPNPAFTATYTGFVPGQTESALGGTLTFTTSATQSSGAGTYPVTPGGLTSANYAFTYQSGTLTVNRAPLTVTADNQQRHYGAADPAYTATYTGLVLGQSASALDGTLAFTTPALPNSAPGTYPLTPSGLTSPNYTISFAAGTLTVDKAPLTIKADDKQKRVGTPNPPLTVTYTGFVLGQDVTALTGTLSVTTTATQTSPPGSYPIVVAGVTSDNYAITLQNGTLTVTNLPTPPPLVVTVTVDSVARPYGDQNPKFTAQIAGLPVGAHLQLDFSTDATPESPVGTYPIRAAIRQKDANLQVTLVPGTLTVTRAPLTVTPRDTERLYGVENPPLTGKVDGLRNQDPITATYSTTATSASLPGTYPITATLADPSGKLGNYAVTLRQGTLTVRNCRDSNGTTVPGSLRCPLDPDSARQVVSGLTRGAAEGATVVAGTTAQVDEAIANARAAGAQAPVLTLETLAGTGAQGAVLDAPALARLAAAGGAVRVKTTYGTLLLPPSVVADLARQSDAGQLVILFEPVSGIDVAGSGQPHAGDLKPASPVVEVTVATRRADGTPVRHETFGARLTLTLPLTDPAADPELAGIYRFSTDQQGRITGIEYVGGTLDSQTGTVSVPRESLSLYGVMVYDRQYADVPPSHWAYRAVKVMTARHVVEGVSDTLFDPERPVTRAEFAAMVARTFGVPVAPSPALTFADVAADMWYAPVMSAVVQAGLYSPEAGNTLRPDVPITRQEMAMVIARAMERFYPKAALPHPDANQVLAPYADRSELTAAATDDLARLVAAGLIRGRAADQLAPNGTTTRAEAVTLIKRLLDWGSNQTH